MPDPITDAEIAYLKTLARLEMSQAETQQAKTDINNILGSFQRLQELDLDAYPEMPRPVPLVNVLRDDETQKGLTQLEAMGVAVEAEDGFYKVPRTVE